MDALLFLLLGVDFFTGEFVGLVCLEMQTRYIRISANVIGTVVNNKKTKTHTQKHRIKTKANKSSTKLTHTKGGGGIALSQQCTQK